MSTSKKGRRRVQVGGTEYAWHIRRKPTSAQGLRQSPMRLAEQTCAAGPRSVLVVDLGVSRPDNWVCPRQISVMPAGVRDIVRRALAAGWVPGKAGAPFSFR